LLEVGQPVPNAIVWTAPRETASLREVIAGDPALLVFYLFDWSST
jgi:hypothetical protein